jgi:hypothetical protein
MFWYRGIKELDMTVDDKLSELSKKDDAEVADAEHLECRSFR